MDASSSKRNILKKIRKALSESTPLPFPASQDEASLFHSAEAELEVQFAEEFSKLQGKFVFCLNTSELQQHLVSLASREKWLNIYCSEKTFTANTGFTCSSNSIRTWS